MTSRSEQGIRLLYSRITKWVLIEGNRLLITGGVTFGFFLVTWGLITGDILSIGPRSPITSILASGAVAGLFSLISVTLAINQLISSRVFGSLDRFQEKMQGGTELRDTVADIAQDSSPPVHTADFISYIGSTLQEQANGLEDEYAPRDDEIDAKIATYVDELTEYTEVVQQVSNDIPAEKVISTLSGPDFAHYYGRTDALRSKHQEDITADEHETLDTIATLLSTIAVFRQYFKTIALHQELAKLSIHFIFVGFPAVAVAMLVPLLYKMNPAEVLLTYPLAPIVSATLAIILAPLVLLMTYVLRIATIFRYTVSVAPFAPPAEWPWKKDP